jgi:hypothetical protein
MAFSVGWPTVFFLTHRHAARKLHDLKNEVRILEETQPTLFRVFDLEVERLLGLSSTTIANSFCELAARPIY